MTSRYDLGKCAVNVTGRAAMIGIQYGAFERKIGEDYHGVIHCVDLWQDAAIYEIAKQNLCNHAANHATYYLHKKDSLEAAKFFKDGELDFVYIDANHFFNEVLFDMDAWFPKVRSGGIFAGHDYTMGKDIEVKEAVDKWMGEKGFTFNITDSPLDCFEGTPYPTWWMIKP